jgi:hypothetical protein
MTRPRMMRDHFSKKTDHHRSGAEQGGHATLRTWLQARFKRASISRKSSLRAWIFINRSQGGAVVGKKEALHSLASVCWTGTDDDTMHTGVTVLQTEGPLESTAFVQGMPPVVINLASGMTYAVTYVCIRSRTVRQFLQVEEEMFPRILNSHKLAGSWIGNIQGTRAK